MIKLFELRTEKGLSQREMAKVLNVSQGTYNNWENGRTQPSIEQLKELSRFFSVSVDYLIGNTDEYGKVTVASAHTQEEQKLLKRFRGMDEWERLALLKLLEKF